MKTDMTADFSRRNFLKGSFAFGGLMATGALPALADDPLLFPQRGRWERLSIVSHHIKAGASKPFAILHISDTHLTAAYPDESEAIRNRAKTRSITFGGRQEEALRDSLAWAKEHVDYVVHTGDLIDFQTKANFDLIGKLCGDSFSMMTCAPGNHEFYHEWKKDDAFDSHKLLQAEYPFDISFRSSIINGINFVTLDNSSGNVSPEQAAKFEAEVKKGLPIILAMHCPIKTAHIVRSASRFWRSKNLKDIPDMGKFICTWKKEVRENETQDFYAYLASQPLLKAILAGHNHVTAADRFSPTAMEYVVGGNFLFHGAEITIE